MLNSIYYLFGYNSSTSNSHYNNIIANKLIITADELKNVKLKKSSNINNLDVNKNIKNPAFARYAKPDEFNLFELSKKQLEEILNTKLKHITPNKKQTYWEPEHPVLNELLKKTPKIN